MKVNTHQRAVQLLNLRACVCVCPQKHTMSVLDGVTVVCTVCVEVIQSGDKYADLLDCAHVLNSNHMSLFTACL